MRAGVGAASGILGGSLLMVGAGRGIMFLVEVENVLDLIHGRHIDWLWLNEISWFWKLQFEFSILILFCVGRRGLKW